MLIPAIDLISGKVVRLKQGDFAQKTEFAFDPVERIAAAADAGAELMHIVDLDGAKDPAKRQLSLLEHLVTHSSIPLQVGGGIRTQDDVAALLNLGISRVVVGSAAVKDPSFALHLLNIYGSDHITLALDVNIIDGIPFVATHGWQESSTAQLNDLLKLFVPAGLRHVLITDISKDGMLQGPNTALYASLMQAYPQLDVIASGGISSLQDLQALRQAQVPSAVLGRALLEGRFTLQEALACWQNA